MEKSRWDGQALRPRFLIGPGEAALCGTYLALREVEAYHSSFVFSTRFTDKAARRLTDYSLLTDLTGLAAHRLWLGGVVSISRWGGVQLRVWVPAYETLESRQIRLKFGCDGAACTRARIPHIPTHLRTDTALIQQLCLTALKTNPAPPAPPPPPMCVCVCVCVCVCANSIRQKGQ